LSSTTRLGLLLTCCTRFEADVALNSCATLTRRCGDSAAHSVSAVSVHPTDLTELSVNAERSFEFTNAHLFPKPVRSLRDGLSALLSAHRMFACARACVRVRRAQLRRGPSRHSGRGWLAGAAVGGGVLNSASRRSAVPAGRSRDMPAVSGYGKLSTRGTRRPRFRLTLAIGVPRECAGLGEAGSSGEAPQASVVLVSNRARCQHDVASCSRRNAS
jgi:hypothetical protein